MFEHNNKATPTTPNTVKPGYNDYPKKVVVQRWSLLEVTLLVIMSFARDSALVVDR
jgi:hypothetical protein